MTHSELVEIGYKWLLSKCAFAIKELVTHTVDSGESDHVIPVESDHLKSSLKHVLYFS